MKNKKNKNKKPHKTDNKQNDLFFVNPKITFGTGRGVVFFQFGKSKKTKKQNTQRTMAKTNPDVMSMNGHRLSK